MTLAKNPKNVKMYFDHENYVFVFKMHQILHAPSYDHFQGFPPTPGLQGLKKQVFLMISHFDFFGLKLLSDPPCFGGMKSVGWAHR